MRLQLLELYWDIGFGAIGFSLLELGWYSRALISIHFMVEDEQTWAQLSGSLLWFNFCIGGTQRDTLP
jgi:hypothetical protein